MSALSHLIAPPSVPAPAKARRVSPRDIEPAAPLSPALQREVKKAKLRKASNDYYHRHKDRCAQRTQAWRDAHPERRREAEHLWGKANQQRKNANVARWRAENPELAKAANERLYAKRRAARRAGQVRFAIEASIA